MNLAIGPMHERSLIVLSLALLFVSCMDQGLIGIAAKSMWLVSLIVVCVVNLGAAFGLYICSVALFAVRSVYVVRKWVGWMSLSERPDNIALLVVVVALVFACLRTKLLKETRYLVAAVAVFLAYTIVQSAITGGLTKELFAWFMRMFGFPFVVCLLLATARLSMRDLRAFASVMAVLGLYMAIVSILEHFGLYSWIVPDWIGDPQVNPALESGRSGGLLLQSEWNGFALSLVFCFVLQRTILARGFSRLTSGTLLLLCLVGIYFTYTRGAWLATAIGTVIILVRRPRCSQTKTMAGLPGYLAVILVLCLAIFSSGRMASDRIDDSGTIYYRLNVWTAGLRMASHSPLFGYGFGQFQSEVAKYQTSINSGPDVTLADEGNVAHNTFLEVLVEHGIIGLALYFVVVFHVVTRAKISGQTGWPSFSAGWIIAFTLVYFVNAQFVAAFEPTNNLIYYGTMGLVAGLTKPNPALSTVS